MIFLIGGASHTGKTALAQKMIETYHFPCFSLDHLKMGLIRSDQTSLTPMDDDKLTDYLWPIVREWIKTAIENEQNLIIEGCYFPYNWKEQFEEEYLSQIRAVFLVMTPHYIESHFEDIKKYASVIENRGEEEGLEKQWVLEENRRCRENCEKYGCGIIRIDEEYRVEWRPK